MDISRRELLILPAAAALANAVSPAPVRDTDAMQAVPWSRKVRRVGQLNMTEHDPAVLDVEAWADYWASLKVDVVLVSVTGILAFYQTKVPFHKKGKYLGDRDFFGDCCSAAKKRGMRVIARMSPDLNWEEAVRAHPEWFQRNAQGEAVHHTEDPRLFRTCMFTSYMTDYMPAIMKEINSLYDVDGLFTNAWPPLGSLPVCHCEQCRTLPTPGTIAYWEKFNERTMFLWKLYDSIAKEKNPSNFFFANLGGGIRSSANLVELGKVCEWFQCDNQGRGGDDTPIWGCALQGRVCNAVQSGKMATNVTGAWSTGAVRWRNVYKSPEEARMWLNETLASGMVPYHHIIGGENGLGEDRRSLEPARQYFNWMAKHEPHFVNKRSIANIGVVMGQRTHLFHTPPRGTVMQQYMDGLYYALLEGRFFFDFVHEEKLSAERPGEVLGADAAEHRAPQRRAVPPDRRVRRGGRIAAGDVPDEPLQRSQRAACGFRPPGRVRDPQGGQRHRHDGKCVHGADRKAPRHPQRLRRDTVDPWRRESRADCSSGRSGADRRARLHSLSAGAVVSGRAAHDRASRRAAGERPKPPGVLPGRHRAHHVEVWPHGSGAASAEHDPMGQPARIRPSRFRATE